MNGFKRYRTGGSAIFNILVLIVAAYGIYVGIQYAPQMIESRTIDSILNSIQVENKTEPARSADAVQSKIEEHLMVNHMSSMSDKFFVDYNYSDRYYTIQVNYERKLNLLFVEKTLKYQKSVALL